ncbi:phage tail assembly chaperone [Methylobacterium sp. NEAU 140]|uniref:phage tail assembly chaperone n=1 Tax=Methylobacterium sp. NEAU 140 TaxID=3064945 RepID=UPI002733F51C|nr:phage tail assembly chaperone [Methylobacterium sp. NEAU 140]MDP4021408.1 phage tail assembly chaperone [Methylobacterium sp. NEAU 140]
MSVPEDARPAFPWDDALAFGLGTLRWRPRDFWAATPVELAAALGRRGRAASLTRAGFTRLLATHPDPILPDPIHPDPC